MRPGNNQSLHSRYNPRGEAERYIAALNLNEEIRYFILVEPGLGYIVPPLRAKNPDARLISLHASAESSFQEYGSDASWDPASGISPQRFLEREIPDLEAAKIKIIEWRPALAVYGEKYARLLSEAAEFIKRADANAGTVKAFGRRWFKNFFRNLLFVSECVNPGRFDLPVVVAGAGPGLEDAIPLIAAEKRQDANGGPVVLAVSSAVAALKSGGVDPDIVIATDGGGWARLHLFEYYRGRESFPQEKRFLAAAMISAIPSQAAQSPLLVLSDGSLWQNTVLKGLGIPFVSLPQRGTVSASALDLAFGLSEGKVFLCGVDLARRDLKTHARPYSFDKLWEEKACRFNPCYSQIFSRSLEINLNASHGIYASWFGSQLENYPKRLYSLGTNSPVFGELAVSSMSLDREKINKPAAGIEPKVRGLKSGGVLNHSTQIKEKPLFRFASTAFKGNPAQRGASLLAAALNDSGTAEKIAEELRPLIFGQENAGPKELTEKIFSLTEKYRRLNRG